MTPQMAAASNMISSRSYELESQVFLQETLLEQVFLKLTLFVQRVGTPSCRVAQEHSFDADRVMHGW